MALSMPKKARAESAHKERAARNAVPATAAKALRAIRDRRRPHESPFQVTNNAADAAPQSPADETAPIPIASKPSSAR